LLKIITDIKANPHQTKKTKNSAPEKPKIIPIPNPALILYLLQFLPVMLGFGSG